ncbi:MAG: zinc transport system ATP-binding protein [Nitrospirae bacterium]|nr:MAG: zinc transport system ATP-binding protein [Nitrospirota bacterium]
MHETVLSVRNFSFRYAASPVLTDITFDAGPGDYVGLVGPNGSGKSTLIRAVLGLIPAALQNIHLFGAPASGFREWKRIGYLPQRIGQFNPQFPATVQEIISLGLLSTKPAFPKRRTAGEEEAVMRALELLGIKDLRRKMIGELSGGQQQRVFIARALVNSPELLILDEPTAALDPDTRERFYELLDSLNRKQKTTIILITHDIGSIGRYANRLLYLDKRVVFYGGFDDFCRSTEMASYFGDYSQHIICHRHNDEGGERGTL